MKKALLTIAVCLLSLSSFAQWTLAGSTVYPTLASYNVNIGSTAAAVLPLEINKSVNATTARFGASSPVCFVAASPMVGFNTYWSGGYTLFSAGYGGILTFNQGLTGGFQFLTAPSGAAGAAASMTAQLSITNVGDIGIGTTAPSARFSVANKFTVDDVAGDVNFTDQNASITFPAAGAGAPPMIQMFASGTSNSDRMVISHSGTYPTYGLQYQDASDKFNFLANGTPVLTVDLTSQNVGIGQVTPTQKLEVVGNILSNGTITPSDLRLKENVASIHYGLKEILLLRPVSYTWKNEPNGKKIFGLIAQETLPITPEIIEMPKKEGGFYGMNYTELIPVLIKAVQEQQEIIKNLQGDLSEARKSSADEMQQLRSELAQIKKVLGMEASNSKSTGSSTGNK